MYRNHRKLAIALSLLLVLVLAQWLSLAHATEHLSAPSTTHCAVCALQDHFQASTISTLPPVPDVARELISPVFLNHIYTPTVHPLSAIRAPPQTLQIL